MFERHASVLAEPAGQCVSSGGAAFDDFGYGVVAM
jgi:hypothetical protein